MIIIAVVKAVNRCKENLRNYATTVQLLTTFPDETVICTPV